MQLVLDGLHIFLFEDVRVFAVRGVTISILLVFRDFVNEEERERLDPTRKQAFLLREMRQDRLTDLDAANHGLVDVADGVSDPDLDPITESQHARPRVHRLNDKRADLLWVVFGKASRLLEHIEVPSRLDRGGHLDPVTRLAVEAKSRHWRLAGRGLNSLKADEALGGRRGRLGDALHDDLLHELPPVGVHSV